MEEPVNTGTADPVVDPKNEAAESKESAAGVEGDKTPPKKEEEITPKTDPGADEEPPTRKTKFDYILDRKNKQLEKAKQEQIRKKNEELKSLGADEEDELPPDDAKAIEKVVEKKFGKYFTEAEERANENDLQNFLTSDPLGKYFKEFEAKIRAFSKHPSRVNIPIKSIAFEVAGERLLKIGAEIEREARSKADKSKAGGGSSRQVNGGTKDWATASNGEIEDEIMRVKREGS